jgi:two-component system chemotaxis sensor kinase CheA
VRLPRISSVAFKLAGATLAIVALVTTGLSIRLEHSQHEGLLRAKELSASAVTRLFADSCAPAVIFNDPSDLHETLVTLGRNEDVEYVAVWSVDDSGHITRRMSELARGRAEAATHVPEMVELRREPDRVVSLAAVRDIKRKVVGVLVIAFSLARENEARASLERSVLVTASAVAAGLTLLLMALARLLVVGPLTKLARAAKHVEDGKDVAADLDIRSDDEVGQLASAFRSMAAAIYVREEHINQRNEDMRLVLDNVGQGFVNIGRSGAIASERSRVVEDWFGPIDGTPLFWDYLRRFDPELGDYFEVAWTAVIDQVLPPDLCLDQLPRLVNKDGRAYELVYRPIYSGGSADEGELDKAIVIITDVTVRLERERSEMRQREMMSMYRRLIADRPAFNEFFDEATALVREITTSYDIDLPILKRQVHTLKGNCALFGIDSMATLCHAIEDRIDDSASLVDADRVRLSQAWTLATKMRAELVDAGDKHAIAVAREDYERLCDDLRRHTDHESLLASVESWELEPASKRLSLIREQIERLADRLGRAPVDVICHPTTVRLPPRRWATFWSAFAHVVRNTVDHGVQTSEKRIASGKPERATIRVAIGRDRDRVLISIQDDGPGVDWQAIARRARERGLPAHTHTELMAALFTDGISSRANTTSTSGRGVGLGALRAAVDSLGGQLEVSSAGESGTLFCCWLPLDEADTDPLDREVTAKLDVPVPTAAGTRTTPAT